jgi:hypothetical protein
MQGVGTKGLPQAWVNRSRLVEFRAARRDYWLGKMVMVVTARREDWCYIGSTLAS